jgi:L-lactate dehydrogenase complex protein LldE
LNIALFITCYNDTLFPETGKSVVRVLERLGHTAVFPAAQTCCGQMHTNTGYQQQALPLLPRFVEQFFEQEAVVVPSSSCVAFMREHYPAMARTLENTGRYPHLCARTESLLQRVFEFSELLTSYLKVVDVGACFARRVTYHPSCHGLRSLQLGEGPVSLLRNVRGLTLIPLQQAEECCGFGGTFAIKNAAASSAMLADKVDAILNTGAEVCTATDNSCLMQIEGSLHRRKASVCTMHLAEILAMKNTGEHL